MNAQIKTFKLRPFITFFIIAALVFVSGCARYARNVDTLYEPAATVNRGAGNVYIVIPENQQTQSQNIKWVLGKVLDDKSRKIDEAFSTRSPAEIIQTALGLEFKKSGYEVISATKRPADAQYLIDLTKAEINLEQISDLADIKAKCRVLLGMDLFKNGQQIKRLQYESTSSKTDIKERDMLAKNVLQDALQSIMLQAVPELQILFNQPLK
ncbi:MAG: hypothetical protein PHD54_15205 [Desulfuromonadaceae bacterium]|nr:hypothetical protein [Desulfuromonadaceae bacterium]